MTLFENARTGFSGIFLKNEEKSAKYRKSLKMVENNPIYGAYEPMVVQNSLEMSLKSIIK